MADSATRDDVAQPPGVEDDAPEGGDVVDVANRARLELEAALRRLAEGKGTRNELERTVRGKVESALDYIAAIGELEEVDPNAAPAPPMPVPVDEPAEPLGKLVAALARAQGAFPPIDKSMTATIAPKPGKAGYSYKYADLAAVLAAVRPVLSANGLALVQRTERDDKGTILVTELRHAAGGILYSEVDLGQSSSNPQQFGGALTYLRRYEATTLLGIAAEEDRDAQDVEPPGGRRAPDVPAWAAPATEQRRKQLGAELVELIGRDRTVALSKATRETFGSVPDVLVAFMVAFAAHYRGHQGEPEREEAVDAGETAKAQDDAAEQPDPPAPDPGADEHRDEAPTIGPRGYGQPIPVNPDPAAPGASRSPRADELDEPTEAELAELRATAAAREEALDVGDEPPPAPGTIPNPFEEVTGELDEEAIAELRSLGCVCPDPSVELGRVDECPIAGHGIKF